ncbi:hypothetical protein PINS_up014356 [Pythium insidiosum]|nr:hypothetical protein PINS_up014356 [Pythium insidiosum]
MFPVMGFAYGDAFGSARSAPDDQLKVNIAMLHVLALATSIFLCDCLSFVLRQRQLKAYATGMSAAGTSVPDSGTRASRIDRLALVLQFAVCFAIGFSQTWSATRIMSFVLPVVATSLTIASTVSLQSPVAPP